MYWLDNNSKKDTDFGTCGIVAIFENTIRFSTKTTMISMDDTRSFDAKPKQKELAKLGLCGSLKSPALLFSFAYFFILFQRLQAIHTVEL